VYSSEFALQARCTMIKEILCRGADRIHRHEAIHSIAKVGQYYDRTITRAFTSSALRTHECLISIFSPEIHARHWDPQIVPPFTLISVRWFALQTRNAKLIEHSRWSGTQVYLLCRLLRRRKLERHGHNHQLVLTLTPRRLGPPETTPRTIMTSALHLGGDFVAGDSLHNARRC
jgi:hypothetical protein